MDRHEEQIAWRRMPFDKFSLGCSIIGDWAPLYNNGRWARLTPKAIMAIYTTCGNKWPTSFAEAQSDVPQDPRVLLKLNGCGVVTLRQIWTFLERPQPNTAPCERCGDTRWMHNVAECRNNTGRHAAISGVHFAAT